MIPGMNPRQMRQAMKRMGIKQQEIEANRVIIELNDKKIIIDNPSVSKVNMMGQETFQITGEEREEQIDSTPDISEDDINTVIEQTNVSKEEAMKSIEENNGDLAQAIISLQE